MPCNRSLASTLTAATLQGWSKRSAVERGAAAPAEPAVRFTNSASDESAERSFAPGGCSPPLESPLTERPAKVRQLETDVIRMKLA